MLDAIVHSNLHNHAKYSNYSFMQDVYAQTSREAQPIWQICAQAINCFCEARTGKKVASDPINMQNGLYEFAESKLIASLARLQIAVRAEGIPLESLVCAPQDSADYGLLHYLPIRADHKITSPRLFAAAVA